MVIENLIIDFGMHEGLDTEYYLQKGFKVVAIEANPILVEKAQVKFRKEIEDGDLIIEAVGVAPHDGYADFYRNLENSEWSSFDQNLGTRQNTKYDIVKVRCQRPEELFAKHGMPYFVKIDIEGYDKYVVRALKMLDDRPRFLSVEDSGAHCVSELYDVGARHFKFLNQIDKWQIKLPNPALEGHYVDTTFGAATSGPFGKELPGEWMDIETATAVYLKDVRPSGCPPKNGWWDIHCHFD